MTTLRRRLREGALAGAYKVPGPKGDEWRIPAGALEALGYSDRDAEEVPQVTTSRDAAEVQTELAAVLRAIEMLTEQLAYERRLLAAAEADKGSVQLEREAARVEAATLRARLEVAEAELERARRPWWRMRGG